MLRPNVPLGAIQQESETVTVVVNNNDWDIRNDCCLRKYVKFLSSKRQTSQHDEPKW